jgi:glucose-6-phosphate 1-dehydrogenase
MITEITLGLVTFSVGLSAFCVKAILAMSDKQSKLEEFVATMYQSKEENKPKTNLEQQVATDLIKGLKQLRNDDEKHMQLLKLSRKLQQNPQPILNHTAGSDESFNTGGDLIPTNLSKDELDILKEFYGKT